ncbi:MAG TPA: phosphoglycerate dehydrogenase [Clostridiaceae bacterium]|nr:phosphoglycerate dehydrogenase [Clostridiaceae bacterium]
MHKILVAVNGNFENQINRMRKAGLEVHQRPVLYHRDEQVFAEDVSSYNCVIMGGGPWNENVLRYAKEKGNLKMIVKFGVGVDNIDLNAATRLGIAVSNAPGSNSSAVAEHALALIFAITRNIVKFDRAIKAGSWSSGMSDTVIGKTIGLLGFGNIAIKLAEFLKSFPVDIIVYDIYKNEEKARSLGVRFVELEELITTSDIISIHVPLTESTRGMVNKTFFEKMKPSAYIINTSRGAVINEKDLTEALKSKTIMGAALDTFEKEPLPEDSELRRLDNVILTPHSASNTREAFTSIMECCVGNVIEFFVNGQLKNVLNPDFKKYA